MGRPAKYEMLGVASLSLDAKLLSTVRGIVREKGISFSDFVVGAITNLLQSENKPMLPNTISYNMRTASYICSDCNDELFTYNEAIEHKCFFSNIPTKEEEQVKDSPKEQRISNLLTGGLSYK